MECAQDIYGLEYWMVLYIQWLSELGTFDMHNECVDPWNEIGLKYEHEFELDVSK